MKQYDTYSLAQLLPFPGRDLNKYSRGKCVLVGGSALYPGAISLAALSSQRMGAGYTEVFTDPEVVRQVQSYHPSLVVRPWSMLDATTMPETTAKRPCAYVVGCGFDFEDANIPSLTRRLLKYVKAPVVVDGGALRILSAKKMRNLSAQRYRSGLSTIITPHMGEAVRLAHIFGLSTDEPDELCLQLSQAYGVICVLKGPDTFISDGEETLAMREGTPALAKAGTGDVLAGIVGALLAQGMQPIDACVLGTTLHARAGNFAAEQLTSISVCAEDVISCIPKAIQNIVATAQEDEDFFAYQAALQSLHSDS